MAFLMGAGSGVVLALALLETWGSYPDKIEGDFAQAQFTSATGANGFTDSVTSL